MTLKQKTLSNYQKRRLENSNLLFLSYFLLQNSILVKNLGGNMKNHPTHKKIRKTDKSQTFNMQSSALGLLITLIIAIALLLLGSLVAYYSNDPSAFIEPIGYVTPFISAILGGFACSKLNKRDPIPCSALCGGYFVLLSMLASCALPHSLSSSMSIWIRLLIHTLILICFPIGAIMGIKSNNKHKKIHKRK